MAREGAPSNRSPALCAGFRSVWWVRPRRRPLQRAFVAAAFAAAILFDPVNPAQSAGLRLDGAPSRAPLPFWPSWETFAAETQRHRVGRRQTVLPFLRLARFATSTY